MSFLKSILDDLREKRLWPVALGLVVALVAVPVVLSSSTKGQPLAQLPQPGPVSPSGVALPAVSVSATPGPSRLPGRGRDPFSQPKVAPAKTATTSTGTATNAAGTSTTASGTSATASGTSTTATGTSRTVTGTTTTTIPRVTRAPRPTALTARQSYRVTLSITNTAGGVNRIDAVQRLSILPSQRQPRLVELGVLNGGRRVLFAVEPGTIVAGSGTCTPGRIDCEILSLGQNQVENISMQSPTGVVSVAKFAITAITTDEYASVAAARRVRQAESAAGRRLLKFSPLSALSLFEYKASLGAIADLRNLTVGGS